MSQPVVIDANVMAVFERERILEEDDAHGELINVVFRVGHMAIDDEGRALQEYKDTAEGPFKLSLSTWLSNRLLEKKVMMYKMCTDVSIRKFLRMSGLQAKDHKWVQIAIGAKSRTIVTNDVDFFDPAGKAKGSAYRARCMATRTGPLCRSLRKQFGIEVCQSCDAVELIDPPAVTA